MKVILLQDVTRIGRKHEVRQVPDGHARNYLIPRKLAVPATPHNLKWQNELASRVEATEAAAIESFAQFLAGAAAAPIIITAAANEQGHLFKGLRSADIVKVITDAAGVTLPASSIALERPIKEIGEYSISVTLGSRQGTVLISVNAK